MLANLQERPAAVFLLTTRVIISQQVGIVGPGLSFPSAICVMYAFILYVYRLPIA